MSDMLTVGVYLLILTGLVTLFFRWVHGGKKNPDQEQSVQSHEEEDYDGWIDPLEDEQDNDLV